MQELWRERICSCAPSFLTLKWNLQSYPYFTCYNELISSKVHQKKKRYVHLASKTWKINIVKIGFGIITDTIRAFQFFPQCVSKKFEDYLKPKE